MDFIGEYVRGICVDTGEAVIKFIASIVRIQTMVDGGIRVTLDLPEHAIMQAAQLMECKRAGAVLNITAEARIEEKDKKVWE